MTRFSGCTFASVFFFLNQNEEYRAGFVNRS